MDHQNIRFHNVEELEPVEGGWLLRRIRVYGYIPEECGRKPAKV